MAPVARYLPLRDAVAGIGFDQIAVDRADLNPWGTIVAVYFLGTGITGLSMLGIPLWVTNVFELV